jgi:ketosteroid isomerase-like protein
MSEQNVDLVHKYFAAYNSGDMAAVRELYHPDVIVRGLEGWPEPGPFVGREAIMRELELLREPYERDTLELVGEARGIANRLVCRGARRGTGQGPDLNMEFSVIAAWRDGAIFDMEYFWDHGEALEAAGLSE